MNYKCAYSIYSHLDGIQKNGNFKYQYSFKDKIIYSINCLFKNKLLLYEGEISKKNNNSLKIYLNINKNFIFIKKQEIQSYILFKLKYKFTTYQLDKDSKNIYYYFYKKKNFNNVVKYIYILKYNKKEDFENNYTKSKSIFIKYMAAQYYLFKLKFNIPDKEFFIAIFYRFYIFLLRDEIIKKYGLDISLDFNNYHILYLFLKEKKYVSIFYNKIKKEILEEYNNFKIFIHDKEKDINKFQKNLDSKYFNLDNINKIKLTKSNMNKINKKIKNFTE
jgi:hypothetical protein